ncbi:multiple epidermal growth factor-like domains protein 10 isoform X2 [Ostrea edulis]|uniref:multiple epidermal growth factor-like domains protein 10 isoform X2 n=1 Tax=Ostrea edulis TaxID=37623 RepID=UPI0024AFF5F1|nr:multiple epidermal growth factor-like domains protein 10 isoform X2 [Ostrea edulis]
MASITTKPSCNRQGNVCCYNHYLGPTSNICSECHHGYYGLNCKQKCGSGFYGRLCRSSCECPATECNHVTGCINGLIIRSVCQIGKVFDGSFLVVETQRETGDKYKDKISNYPLYLQAVCVDEIGVSTLNPVTHNTAALVRNNV